MAAQNQLVDFMQGVDDRPILLDDIYTVSVFFKHLFNAVEMALEIIHSFETLFFNNRFHNFYNLLEIRYYPPEADPPWTETLVISQNPPPGGMGIQ
jgi:hypothetical protein